VADATSDPCPRSYSPYDPRNRSTTKETTLKAKILVGAAGAALVLALPATAAPPKLKGVVGPGFTITMPVKPKKAGTYRLVVQDKSSIHNFRLLGPGVNVKTSVSKVGTQTFTVKLKAGKTYRFICDPHASTMKGSFKVPQ
jgi:plastocyanin